MAPGYPTTVLTQLWDFGRFMPFATSDKAAVAEEDRGLVVQDRVFLVQEGWQVRRLYDLERVVFAGPTFLHGPPEFQVR